MVVYSYTHTYKIWYTQAEEFTYRYTSQKIWYTHMLIHRNINILTETSVHNRILFHQSVCTLIDRIIGILIY